VRTADLPGLLVTYAALLAAASWLAERLPAISSRLIAAFVLSAVLVRFRATAWAWPAGLLLLALAVADTLASRRAAAGPTRRGTPPV